MSAPLLLVTGTGTGIGKTHLTAALAATWARVLADVGEAISGSGVAALKPVETGVIAGVPSDREALEQASTFHVKRFPPPYMLARAVSPHLAAADEGVRIEVGPIAAYVDQIRSLAGGVLVELPGGLFSPLAPGITNADLASALRADALVLVAPDRLGVLHDVAAATRAARAQGLVVDGIVMVAPEHPDASTGTNASELRVVTDVNVLAVVPREDVATTAARPELVRFVASLVTPGTP